MKEYLCHEACWHGLQYFEKGKFYTFPSESIMPKHNDGTLAHFEEVMGPMNKATKEKKAESAALKKLRYEVNDLKAIPNPTPGVLAEIIAREQKIMEFTGERPIDPRNKGNTMIPGIKEIPSGDE
jgi:hypothetical protein